MKKGWEIKRLPDIAEYFIGLTYSPKDVSDKGTVVLRSSNIQNDEIDLTDIVRVSRPVKDTLKVRKGDILMCSRNGSKRLVGKTAMIGDLPEEMTFGTFMTVVRAIQNPYLAWFFKSDVFRDQIGGGENTMINQITKYMLDAILVPLPPLAEQQRIVGLLDKAFAGFATAQANAEKNLQNARALFASHLQSVFSQRGDGWVERPLGELCDGVEYGSSAKSKKEGKVPVLRMGNIQDGKFNWENLVYSDDEAEIGKYLLKHNDVLFNRTNSPELVGKTAIYKSEMPAIFAGYLIRIHRKEALLDGDYLNYFLNSQIARNYGKTVVISSVNQANINGAKLKGYPIPAPALGEQRRVVAQLDALAAETQRLEALYQQKLAALAALKKSLLHQAFTGEL